MNSIQVTACRPAFNGLNIRHSHVFLPHKNSLELLNGLSNFQCMRLPKISLKLTNRASTYRQRTPVCLFGGKGKLGRDYEDKVGGSLAKAFSEERSLEEELREQIQKLEYGDDGGSDGNGPGGSGGGGGGGDDFDDDFEEDFDEPEDEDLFDSDDEPWQVLGATVGLMLLYSCILDYKWVVTISKDLIKLMMGKGLSGRLKRIVSDIAETVEMAKPVGPETDPTVLADVINGTSTWWYTPRKKTDDTEQEYDEDYWTPPKFNPDDYPPVPVEDPYSDSEW